MTRAGDTPVGVHIRPARAADAETWRSLWRGYCAVLQGEVESSTTDGVWRRILSTDPATGCLLACDAGDRPIGFANYILHPHTWGLQPVCYLEDLFVAPEACGAGVGRALIRGLMSLGRSNGWRRVYWHTHEDNRVARALYDRIASKTDYVRYDVDL